MSNAPELTADELRRIGIWLRSGDTGISSETMASIALGADRADGDGDEEIDFDAPYDPSDFGRCYRLVGAVPGIRKFFPRIGALVPTFAGILNNWDELCGIYLRDMPFVGDELYRRIQELRGD